MQHDADLVLIVTVGLGLFLLGLMLMRYICWSLFCPQGLDEVRIRLTEMGGPGWRDGNCTVVRTSSTRLLWLLLTHRLTFPSAGTPAGAVESAPGYSSAGRRFRLYAGVSR